MPKIPVHPRVLLLTENIPLKSITESTVLNTKMNSAKVDHRNLRVKLIYTLGNIIARPGYFLVFALARFNLLRQIYHLCSQFNPFNPSPIDSKSETLFKIDPQQAVNTLKQDGVCAGLNLPADFVVDLQQYLQNQDCYAGGKPHLGFRLTEKPYLDKLFQQPFYVARYFNLSTSCSQIAQLANDSTLQKIAIDYIGCQAKYTGASLFWTFPIQGISVDSDQQMFSHFHYDIDDVAGLRFCFYLTDVTLNDGPHVCIRGSHIKKRISHILNFFSRIQTKNELAKIYDPDKFLTITGNSGSGFIEDTFCFHKGDPPKVKPRLFLQLHFAAHNYNPAGYLDDRDPAMLSSWHKNLLAQP